MGSAFGGGSSSAQQVFQPSGTAAFDQTFQNLINGQVANNPYAALGPQATNIYQAAGNTALSVPYQNAASQGGAALNTVGQQATASAPQLTQAGNTALTGANQVLQTGFDPQSALYQRTLQQLNDQTNANSAQSGTTNSPYGASVANAANSNFNIDWQNNQLQRQLAGLGGYNSGVAGANSDFSGAQTLGAQGAQDIANAGALPYQANQNVTNNQSSALNQLLSVLGTGNSNYTQQQLGDIMQYLGLGAAQSNIQAGLNQQAQQNAQGGLGQLLGVGFNAFGGSNGGLGSSLGSLGSLFNFGSSAGGITGAGAEEADPAATAALAAAELA